MRRLLCWLGFHQWRKARDPYGRTHTYCAICHEHGASGHAS